MTEVLMDSGPLIALHDRSDRHHVRCRDWLAQYTGGIITTTPVLTEVSHVLYARIGIECTLACLAWAGQALVIEGLAADTMTIVSIMQKYRDLPADYADAGLVALADRLRLYAVASVDRDFTVYRGAAKQPFLNVLFEQK